MTIIDVNTTTTYLQIQMKVKGLVKTSTRTNGNKTENFQVKLSTTSKSKICEGKSKYSLRKVVIAWSILSKSALCPMDHFNIKMYSKSTAEN